jgi:hypothetical protein
MPKDIVALLEEDSASLQRLISDLRRCPRMDNALALSRKFSSGLGGHLAAIRNVVYPALRSMRWKDVRMDVLVGHAHLSRTLAGVLTLRPGTTAFTESLAELLNATEHLLEQEQRHLLDQLADGLLEAERHMMASDAERFLTATAACRSDQPPSRMASDEWLEEARLLIGGMATQTMSASAQG